MKFRDTKDAHLFLLEIRRLDLIDSVTESWTPTPDLIQEYISGRKSIVGRLKDFRKSQDAKASWRKNRHKIMRGIKSYHKSTDGKQFHRQLGRYLATRVAKSGRHEDYSEKYEALKAISSLRTHIYIDNGYFKPLEEQVEFDLFMDEIIPVTLREELNIYNETGSSSDEDLDILCRSISPNVLLREYCEIIGKEFNENVLKLFNDSLCEEKSIIESLKEIV